MSLAGRLLSLFSILCLFGCGDARRLPLIPEAIVGTKAVIRAHGKDLTLRVVSVAEKVVVSDMMDWNGQLVSRRHYYRGLYPVAGTEGVNQWEVDFDHSLLESVFPLKIGNATSFYGNMKDISTSQSYNFWAKVKVMDEKPFSLPSGTHNVFLVKITTEYDWNGKREKKEELVYFSPEYSMNLKGVMHEGTAQRYWRVVSVEKPGENKSAPVPARPRSSGTVMI